MRHISKLMHLSSWPSIAPGVKHDVLDGRMAHVVAEISTSLTLSIGMGSQRRDGRTSTAWRFDWRIESDSIMQFGGAGTLNVSFTKSYYNVNEAKTHTEPPYTEKAPNTSLSSSSRHWTRRQKRLRNRKWRYWRTTTGRSVTSQLYASICPGENTTGKGQPKIWSVKKRAWRPSNRNPISRVSTVTM